MGAVRFEDIITAKTPEEGFDMLVKEARYEYGYDSYNGTISTCRMVSRPYYTFEGDYKETNLKKAMEMIAEYYTEKCLAYYIDLGVVEYQLITAKKVNKANKPKYKMCYTIKDHIEHLTFENKTEAANAAMKLAIKYNRVYRVHKEYVLCEGNSTMVEVKPEVKRYKSKPKNVPKGAMLREIHKYLFFGDAAE